MDFDDLASRFWGQTWAQGNGSLLLTLEKMVVASLGGVDRRVAQEGRDGGEVSPAGQHDRSKEVANVVGADVVYDAGAANGRSEGSLD